MKYSVFSLLKNARSYHQNWPRAWRSPDPKSHYDVIIVGGGGHGLATAYYLARECGIRNVAVIEKGWLGGGNTGRNTTIVRSNYLWDASAALYDHSVNLWHGLSQELNYNVMFSPRGLLHLAHSVHDMQEIGRRGNSNFLNGIDAEFLTPEQVKKMVPIINLDCRYPVMGALLQRRGGVARHDAVAWGYARAADELGVDIIQQCEVTGFKIDNGVVKGVHTSRGTIGANKVGCVVAGHCSVLADMAGFRLPIESFPLQALVSEPIKPIINCVVMSNGVHAYISQSDKGELVIGASSGCFQFIFPARQFRCHRRYGWCHSGALSYIFPYANVAPVGWNRRRDNRSITTDIENAGEKSVLQLWLGYWGIQGHTRFRTRFRPFDCVRRYASDRGSLFHRTFLFRCPGR